MVGGEPQILQEPKTDVLPAAIDYSEIKALHLKEAKVQYAEFGTLSPSDLPKDCGFKTDEVAKSLFERVIAEALRNHRWKRVTSFRKPDPLGAQYIDNESIRVLEQLMSKKGHRQVAADISEGQVWLPSPMVLSDITATTLDLLGETFPSLMLFRGGPLDVGYVYGCGNLPKALVNVAKNPYKNRPSLPVIAMVKANDAVQLCLEGPLRIKPALGLPMWQALTVSPFDITDKAQKDAVKEIIVYRKPPATKEERDILLHAFGQRAIASFVPPLPFAPLQ